MTAKYWVRAFRRHKKTRGCGVEMRMIKPKNRRALIRLILLTLVVPLVLYFAISCEKDSPTRAVTVTNSLTKISGDFQIGVQGDTLSVPLSVLVTDPDGKALKGELVTFSITEGDGVLFDGKTITNVNGRASIKLILGHQEGLVRIETVSSAGPDKIIFVAFVGVNQPKIIDIVSGDGQKASPGERLPEPLEVLVKDSNGRPYQGINVKFAIESGLGILSIMSDTTSSDGTVRTQLTLSDSVGVITVSASVEAPDSLISTLFTCSAESATLEIWRGDEFFVFVDDKSSVRIQARLKNYVGSVMEDVPVFFVVQEGDAQLSDSEVTTHKSGLATSNVTPSDFIGDIKIMASSPYVENPVYFTGSISSLSRIAYHYDGDIYTINTDGSCQRLLRSVSTSNYESVTWSPDGVKIMSNRLGAPTGAYSMNWDGTQSAKVAIDGLSPSWSPDGEKIAYWMYRGNYLSLETVTSYKYGFQIIFSTKLPFGTVTHVGKRENPAWSPDGSRIVFGKADPLGDGLYIADSVGGNQSLLYENGSSPSWSPDGSAIAFSSTIGGNADIYLISPDGTGLQKLTNNSSENVSPSWSPDGSEIVFSSDMTGYSGIHVMNSDGSNVRLIAEGSYPSWSPVIER